MKEAILIVVADGFNGLGDFLFALKTAENLRHQYTEKGEETPPIYLVTQVTGKEKIQQLKGDVEFAIEVLTPNDLRARVRAQGDARIIVGHVIEGPVLSNNLIDKVNTALTQINVPLITTGEYGNRDEHTLTANLEYRQEELSALRWVDHIQSGFNKARSESGILQRAKIISRQDAILSLTNQIKSALGLQDETFFNQNEISFQYSHDEIQLLHSNRVLDNPAQRFLEIHRSFYKKNHKNHIVIMIGKALDYKFNALRTIQQFLINDGFQKITFYNAVNDEETILHNSGKTGKQYKVLYYEGFTYQTMINCIAISGPLMGVTGDQSFAEALQYDKIPVYETIEHKIDFIADYEQRLYELSGNDPVVEKCLEILRPLAAPSGQRRINASKEDGAYLHQHQTKLREMNQKLMKQTDLGERLYAADIKAFKKMLLQEVVDDILSKSAQATYFYNEHRHKLYPDSHAEITVLSVLVKKIGIVDILDCFYLRKKNKKESLDMAAFLISLHENNDSGDALTTYQSIFISLITHQEQVCLQSILSKNLPKDVSDAFYSVVTKRDENHLLYFTHLSTIKGFEISKMYIQAMYACTEALLNDILTDTDQAFQNTFNTLNQSFLQSLPFLNDKTKQTEAHDVLMGLFLLERGKRHPVQSDRLLSSANRFLSQWSRRHKSLLSSIELVLNGLGINAKELPHDESHYTQQYEIFMANNQPKVSSMEDRNRFYPVIQEKDIHKEGYHSPSLGESA